MAEERVSIDRMKEILGLGGGQTLEELGQASLDDDGNLIITNTTLKALTETVMSDANKGLKPALQKGVITTAQAEGKKLKKHLDEELEKQRTELLGLANETRRIEVKSGDVVKKLEGIQHNQFENLLRIVGTAQPVLMVGPAGTGKTKSAEDVAETLGLSFFSISVGSQTSKSDLVGYMHAAGGYVATQFRQAYENGGVFLLDEADAGNSNVLILLNAALSNGYMAFPDKMVRRHDDFRMIATANTFGHGANRQYVGRNQLDAATLDRFVTITWDIDNRVETAMAGTEDTGKKWLKVVQAIRKRAVEELQLRVVVSPRATLRGSTLLAAGMAFEDVLQVALVGNMPAHEKPGLENLARTVWAG